MKKIFKKNIQKKNVQIFSANERVVVDFSINGKNPGFLPDGLTIDTGAFIFRTDWLKQVYNTFF